VTSRAVQPVNNRGKDVHISRTAGFLQPSIRILKSYATETVWGGGGVTPRGLDLVTSWT
jgi:hypothetical protein